MAKSLPVYNCDGCGLCCERTLIEATAVDVLREPRIEIESPLGPGAESPIGSTWILNDVRNPDGPSMACKFLGADKRCGIYATRPSVCVAFQAGGAKCRSLRKEFGKPPLLPATQDGSTLDRVRAEAVDEPWEEWE